jgi:predicted RND superfamily exporter protein
MDALARALGMRILGVSLNLATILVFINAAGFLALAFSSFPPLRQFGLVTSAAFVLELLADFTALPAGLWLTRRGRVGAD